MTSIGVYQEHLDICTSTMEVARERVAQRAEVFGLISATEQTAGRGRRGNTWQNPQEGFLGTIWIKTGLNAAQLSGLSLGVGVLVTDTLQALGASAWLKWPNDIVTIDGRKLGGILVEVGSSYPALQNTYYLAQDQFVLIGIGLNMRPPADVAISAAGLKNLSPNEFAQQIVTLLPAFWQEFSKAGLAVFLTRWRARCITLGKTVEFSRGIERERAVFADVGESGEALLEINGRIERFFSVEIHTVREVR